MSLRRGRSRSRGGTSSKAAEEPQDELSFQRSTPLDLRRSGDLTRAELHGWFNLLFILCGFFVVTQNYASLTLHGKLSAWREFLWLWKGAVRGLPFLSAICGSAILFPFVLAKLNASKIIGRTTTVVILAIFTAVFLCSVFAKVWLDDAPASQLIFLLALSACLWMKFHSYVIVNASLPKPNISMTDLFYFICCPCLVYQTNFIKTKRIRVGYLLEKIGMIIVLFSSMHNLVTSFIMPVLMEANRLSIVDFVSKILVPMTMFYIMLFLIVFEGCLNAVAEVLFFADRDFYGPWWNATTFDEFARLWNRPVHKWLFAHIYGDAKLRVSSGWALFLTFLFSSLMHELLLVVLTRSPKPFLFPLQMSQIGLIFLGKRLRGTKLGNYVFHIGIGLGIPLLTCFYAREYTITRLLNQ